MIDAKRAMQIKVIDTLDDVFKDFANSIEQKSIEIREHFLNSFSVDTWREFSNISDFYQAFKGAYLLLSFTANEKVFEKYNLILNKSLQYKWNISIDDFFARIDELNSRNIIHIWKYEAFYLWFHYVDIQIDLYCRKKLLPQIAQLEQFKNTVDRKTLRKLKYPNFFDDEIVNHSKRMGFDRKKALSEFDQLLNETNNVSRDFARRIDLELNFKALRNQVKNGKVEKELLGPILRKSLPLPGCQTVDRCSEIFDLLMFLLKDADDKKIKLSDKNNFPARKGIFKNNYRFYKKSQIITLLGLR